ncbi:MAG TPA: urate oxidase [Streptosporangiaceae bacterium]|jgi:urate oxidase
MAVVLSANQYGKAETRVVRIYRDTARHQIRDLNVTTTLHGDFAAAYTHGDQTRVLPTDSQKNTCFAYASEHGVASPEQYAMTLASHFVDDIEPVSAARVDVDEYPWERLQVGGEGHPHTFIRSGQEVRTAAVTVTGTGAGRQSWVVSGLRDLVVLKSTGSEFAGFLKDRYTTLPETHDRVLATALSAQWRYESTPVPWDEKFPQVRRLLLERFAQVHSLALQQTLWEMGKAVLEAHPDVAEVRLSAPNKHHFLADLSPFGLDNPGEVFYAADRPYGLIQCAVQRDDASDPGPAWSTPATFT